MNLEAIRSSVNHQNDDHNQDLKHYSSIENRCQPNFAYESNLSNNAILWKGGQTKKHFTCVLSVYRDDI